ncbi:cytidine deaminase [Pelagibacterium montanilacus]|uniref:cytidine deaminase n=1 Tax=Pelagibacterium montanilacus TaxID=2185280 RepID=UPI0013DF5D88|nr:cytidine deaminase [Pelagibacterium montanilacus]
MSSRNPFVADRKARTRFEDGEAAFGEALRAAAAPYIATDADSVIPRAAAQGLVERFGLGSTDQLMVHLVALAAERATPPLSGFHVGAVGLEAETGALVLGWNLEFPGAPIAMTIHAEGFVATRAYARGNRLARIAISEAHPCAHCRQYLCEFDWRDEIELIDPLGHRLMLADLYPWPFDPAYLGGCGAVPGRTSAHPVAHGWTVDGAVRDALLEAGARSHTPYSQAPAAAVIEMRDGTLLSGVAIESVAFNPTMTPIQAALIALVAHGYDYEDIAQVHVGADPSGPVDHGAATRQLMGALAPDAGVSILAWSRGAAGNKEGGHGHPQ